MASHDLFWRALLAKDPESMAAQLQAGADISSHIAETLYHELAPEERARMDSFDDKPSPIEWAVCFSGPELVQLLLKHDAWIDPEHFTTLFDQERAFWKALEDGDAHSARAYLSKRHLTQLHEVGDLCKSLTLLYPKECICLEEDDEVDTVEFLDEEEDGRLRWLFEITEEERNSIWEYRSPYQERVEEAFDTYYGLAILAFLKQAGIVIQEQWEDLEFWRTASVFELYDHINNLPCFPFAQRAAREQVQPLIAELLQEKDDEEKSQDDQDETPEEE